MIRIKWWPVGHHLFPADKPPTKDEQMTLQQSLELAEIEADMAYEKFLEAFDADEHPELLEQLNTTATLARHRYYDALNSDLAL
ncbi:MAG: hypothetical protein JKY29_14195 [Gammaproteobacteria bacterium]|nr:hypothetical protein [Gammaproteobacteria bacterium]